MTDHHDPLAITDRPIGDVPPDVMRQLFPLYTTPEAQAELAEEIADLLDEAVHLEGCYIDPNDTHCVCLIGKLRAVLPQCGETRTLRTPDSIAFDGEGFRMWRCQRVVHPSTPDKHVFGEV